MLADKSLYESRLCRSPALNAAGPLSVEFVMQSNCSTNVRFWVFDNVMRSTANGAETDVPGM